MLFVLVFSSLFDTMLALKPLHRLISHHKLVLVSFANKVLKGPVGQVNYAKAFG